MHGDISRQLKINRISLSKYLATMVARGEIEYRSIGRAKLYTLTKRIPLESIFGHTEDHVIITDNDGMVTQIEERTAALFACSRSLMIGKPLGEGSTCRFFSSDGSPLSARQMTETGSGELLLYSGEHITSFSKKSIPVVLTDGSRGNACILTDITEKKRAEKDLREINEYLQILFNYASAPIIVWDPKFRITRFNHAFEYLTGRTEREVLGQPLDILFPAESRDASLALIKKTLEGEHWETVEIPILTNDGSVRTVLWNSANILSADGELVSTIAQGIDISEHKLVEEKLRGNERKYRTLIENIPEKIFLKDTASVYISCNDNLARDLGIPASAIAGKTDFDFFPHDLAEKYQTDDRRVIESGAEELFEEQYTIGDAKHWVKTLKALARDDAGKITGILGIFHDFSREKLAEDALRDSEEKYRTIFMNSDEGIFRSTSDGRFVSANPAVARMLGYDSPEELISAVKDIGVQVYIDPDDRVRLTRLLKKEGVLKNYEMKCHNKNGNSIWVMFNVHVVRDVQGNIVFFEGTCQDVTERKLAENALKDSEEKYRHLVETMNEGLLAVDKNCIITFVNNRYCEMVGYSLDELIGKPSVMLNAPECTNVTQAQWAIRMQGNSGSYHFRLLRKDGKKINALAAARPVYDDNGQLNGSLIIVTDLTPMEKTSL